MDGNQSTKIECEMEEIIMNNTIAVLNKEILGERKRSWNGNRFMSRVSKSV